MDSFAPTEISPLKVVDYYLSLEGVDNDKKQALIDIRNILVKDASIYRMFASNIWCNALPLLKTDLNNSQIKIMKLLYDRYINKSGVRELLVKKFLFCPACLTNIISISVNTLDHFLPKEYFPSYYLLPDNLVPMCGDCNRVKGTAKPQGVRNTLPHPYFDKNLLRRTWLKVTFENFKPLVFDLEVECINDKSRYQLELHLKTFKRKESYLALLNREFSSIEGSCKDEFCKGPLNLQQYLTQQAKSSKGRDGDAFKLNSIQYILYKSLSESNWFCYEYFK